MPAGATCASVHRKQGRKCSMKMLRTGVAALVAVSVASTAWATLTKEEAKRLSEATAVLSELRGVPDNGIPDRIWEKARCVVVIPSVKKAAFIIGGEFGEGVMSCRQGNAWGAPVFMQLAKGSAGFQIGASSTDLVLVVMNDRGVERLLHNKVTLGGDASVAAGPVGRAATAATDIQMSSEMLAYSRSKGIFAGIDLSGGTLKPDEDANQRAYGPGVNPSDVALGRQQVTMPPEALAFVSALNKESAPTTGVSKPSGPAKPSGTSKSKKPTGAYK